MKKAVVVLLSVVSVLMWNARTVSAEPISPHVIVAVGPGNAVRISGDSEAAQMRLQLLTAGGALVYDSSWKRGNVFDWPLQDSFGHGIAYGSYQMVLMSADVAGHDTARRATLQFEPGNVRIESDEVDVASSDLPSLVRIGHDGARGELAVTQGDLSFRFGDFLAGKDVEVMRLTAAGNLDVAGVINARQGIRFPDGTIQETAAVPSVVRLPSFRPAADISGTGTLNTIAKWTDNAGTLGDALMTESAGKVVVGVGAPNGGQIQILGNAVQDIFSGMGVDVAAGPAMNFGYAGNSFGRSAGFFNMRADAAAVAPNPSLRFMTGGQQRMIITNLGNIGIGTGFTGPTAPVDKLEVAGNLKLSNSGHLIFPDSSFMTKAGATLDANNFNGSQSVTGNIVATGSVSAGTVVHGNTVTADAGIISTTAVSAGTQFQLGGARFLTESANASLSLGTQSGDVNVGNFNLFVGTAAGLSETGSYNTILGANAGLFTTGNSNTIVGNFAGNAPSGCCNSVFGFQAGNTMTGSYNAFFGLNAGQGPNQTPSINTGNSNAGFGTAAGFSLAGGGNNVLFGTNAGYYITTGNENVVIGDSSGYGITTEINNTLLGAEANVSAGVHDSTIIGRGALATQSNSLILGPANTSVGIGTTAPISTLEVRKDVEGGLGPVLTMRNASGAGGGTAAIDMNTAGNNPNGVAGVRLTAIDNNFSGDLIISTKTPGGGGTGTLAERVRVNNIGVVRINTPATSTPVGAFLDVNGFARLNLATGVSGETQVCRNATSGLLTNCLASSIRYKDAIETYTGSVNVLRQLRPVTFRWKADGGRDFGFIAEEVARVEPLLSVHDEHGEVNGVRYDHLGVLLVNAVKEEAAELDRERTRADRLQTENQELRARLDRLEHVVERLVQK